MFLVKILSQAIEAFPMGAIIEPNSKLGTLMGWAATVGGTLQLLWPRLVASTSDVSNVLVGLAAGLPAVTGVAILAYQQFREVKRKALLADQDAFKSTWEGKVALLEEKLALASVQREALQAEVNILKQKDRRTRRLAAKLKLKQDETACPFSRDGKHYCQGLSKPPLATESLDATQGPKAGIVIPEAGDQADRGIDARPGEPDGPRGEEPGEGPGVAPPVRPRKVDRRRRE